MMTTLFLCDSWALGCQSALSAVITYSSMGLLLCLLARMYFSRANASSSAEPRIVGMGRTKSPSESLEVMANGVSLVSPLGYTFGTQKHFRAFWLWIFGYRNTVTENSPLKFLL